MRQTSTEVAIAQAAKWHTEYERVAALARAVITAWNCCQVSTTWQQFQAGLGEVGEALDRLNEIVNGSGGTGLFTS